MFLPNFSYSRDAGREGAFAGPSRAAQVRARRSACVRKRLPTNDTRWLCRTARAIVSPRKRGIVSTSAIGPQLARSIELANVALPRSRDFVSMGEFGSD